MAPRTQTNGHQPSDEVPTDPDAMIRIGTVAEVALAQGTIVVECGEVRTGAISFSTGRAGATRFWSPPSVGEQVLLLCPGGDIEAAVALGALAQESFPLPGATLRELIAFGDGAELAYDPEAHRFEIQLPAGATIAIVSDGGVAIEGDVAIDGNLSLTGNVVADGDVTGDGISLKDHIHSEVAAGTSVSGKPVP